ncbi:MAG: SDR family oxidoreductase, partial [Bacteroidota bacterium]
MKGKVVIITGASSGIGKACAKCFLDAGSMVVINARSIDKLNDLLIEWKDKGDRLLAVAGDVSKEDDCKNIVEQTIQKFGRIDVLINNAGLSMRALFETMDLDVLRKLMDINFWGTVYCTKYALPYILKNKGTVAGISSIAGKKGLPGRTGYSSSKFAMEGFLETVRIENLKKGLHVLVACPGFTATNIRNTALSADGTAQGESPRDESAMMPADEVADAIYNAIVNRKRDLVLTTTGKLTVWINKFFPSWSD